MRVYVYAMYVSVQLVTHLSCLSLHVCLSTQCWEVWSHVACWGRSVTCWRWFWREWTVCPNSTTLPRLMHGAWMSSAPLSTGTLSCTALVCWQQSPKSRDSAKLWITSEFFFLSFFFKTNCKSKCLKLLVLFYTVNSRSVFIHLTVTTEHPPYWLFHLIYNYVPFFVLHPTNALGNN